MESIMNNVTTNHYASLPTTPRQSQHITKLHQAIIIESLMDKYGAKADGSYYSMSHSYDDERIIEISSSQWTHQRNTQVTYTVTNTGPKPSPEVIDAIYARAEMFGHFFNDFGRWLQIKTESDFNTSGDGGQITQCIEKIVPEIYDFIKLYEGKFTQRVHFADNAGGTWGEVPFYTFSIRAEAGSDRTHDGIVDYPILSLRLSEQLLFDYLGFYFGMRYQGEIVDLRANRFRSTNLMMHDLLRIFK
jgi:hypothetical protein